MVVGEGLNQANFLIVVGHPVPGFVEFEELLLKARRYVESHMRCAACGCQVATAMPGDLVEAIIPIIVVLVGETHGVREITPPPRFRP